MTVLGWALVHFLWQGAATGALLAAILAIVPRSAPRARYAFGCTALAAMLCCLPITVAYLSQAASLQTLVSVARPGIDVPTSPTPFAALETMRVRFEGYLPWLVVAWMLGVAVLLGRVAGGWIVSRRWVQHASPLDRDLDALMARLGVARAVDVLVSPLAAVPHAVGWMKPAVVLPLGVVTGLPAEQLEAIIAHELAHVARHDFLVNLVQTFAESVLFFHPAVWWTSARVREDREACCDDMVVALTGDPAVYARALLSIEDARVDLVLAATGSDLRSRIERMLRVPRRETRVAPFCVAAATLVVLAGATWLRAESIALERSGTSGVVSVEAAPVSLASTAPQTAAAPLAPLAPLAPPVPPAPQAPPAPPAPLAPQTLPPPPAARPVPPIPAIPPVPEPAPLTDDALASEALRQALEHAREAIAQASETFHSEAFKAEMRRTIEEAARHAREARHALARARPALERARAAAEKAKAQHGAMMTAELTKAIEAARAAADEARKVVESEEFKREIREALEEALRELRDAK